MPRQARPWYSAEKGWWMVYVDGQKKWLVKGPDDWPTRLLAEKKHRELLYLRDTNPAPEGPERTVASIIELYLKVNGKRYDERSLSERKHYLQRFAEAHGFRKVTDKDCLPVHLEQWVNDHPEWKSDWTVSQVLNIVQRPFNWAVKKRLILANPFRGVERRTGQPRRPLTDKEFQSLLRSTSVWLTRQRSKKLYPCDARRRQRPSAGARFRQMLVFLRYTGARPGEAAALEWEDIDIENAVIVLNEHKTSKTQRVKKPRVIPLHAVVVKLLISIRKRNEPGKLVFLTHRKSAWNRCNLGQRMRRAREIAGVPTDAKLYGLRHAFGTRSIINGVDIKTLAELMGHTTTRMTEHYLHLSGQRAHLADAMRRANDRRQAL